MGQATWKVTLLEDSGEKEKAGLKLGDQDLLISLTSAN